MDSYSRDRISNALMRVQASVTFEIFVVGFDGGSGAGDIVQSSGFCSNGSHPEFSGV